jgi:hypothetical protein
VRADVRVRVRGIREVLCGRRDERGERVGRGARSVRGRARAAMCRE